MDSTPVDTSKLLMQVRVFADATLDLRRHAERMNAMRDEAIRELDRASIISRTELAEMIGVERSRLYVILANVDDDDEDGQIALHQEMEELMDQTLFYWSEAGMRGNADDYFPIENVLRRES